MYEKTLNITSARYFGTKSLIFRLDHNYSVGQKMRVIVMCKEAIKSDSALANELVKSL